MINNNQNPERINQALSMIENQENCFLTREQVRADPKYANATDEEVENIIHTLHTLALAAYDVYCKEEEQKNKDAKNNTSESL